MEPEALGVVTALALGAIGLGADPRRDTQGQDVANLQRGRVKVVEGHRDLARVTVPVETAEATLHARGHRCAVVEELDSDVELGVLVVLVVEPEPEVGVVDRLE